MIDIRKYFRCPFHKKASQEGSLLDIEISGKQTPSERINLFRKGYLELFENAESTSAAIFSFPEIRCTDFEHLKETLFPYQIEKLAAELDLRLNPWLPYQIKKLGMQERIGVADDPFVPQIASALVGFIFESCKFMPGSLNEFCRALEITFRQKMFGKKWDSFNLTIELLGQKNTFYIGGAEFEHLVHPQVVQTIANTNCFHIITCPLYPKQFGRYSDVPKIVMSRQRDFTLLPKEERQQINRASNSVLIAHGVHLENGLSEMLPSGLWVPKFK